MVGEGLRGAGARERFPELPVLFTSGYSENKDS